MAEVPGAPDRWQSYVARLPEEYRTDPETFITAYEERQREVETARAEAAEKARYETWYTEQYLPWMRREEPLLQEFNAWKRTQGTPAPAAGRGKTAEPAPTAIDWEDADAPRRAYEATVARLDAIARAAEERTNVLAQEFQQGRDSLMGLVGLLEDARKLERDHPGMDITAVAKWAADHKVQDLNLAYNEVYRDQSTATQVKDAVAKARQQWEQEQKTREIHTERGPGVSSPHVGIFRRPSTGPEGTRAGSRAERDEALYRALEAKVPNAQW